MKPPVHFDAYTPDEMAARVRDAGSAKAARAHETTLMLAVLAGGFIGLGACFSTAAVAGTDLAFGLQRLVAGTTFCLGLILVVVAGAELFTGNNLIVMAWASKRISSQQLLQNWLLVFSGNMIGAVGLAALVYGSGVWRLGDHAVGATALSIGVAKCQIGFSEALFRGILCNMLVCLAVWLCFSAGSTTDKILAILFPITAFVALGFEHSIANLYFIPMAIALKSEPSVVLISGLTPAQLETVSALGFWGNLLPVTLGNIIGGGLFVAAVYWMIYLRPTR